MIAALLAVFFTPPALADCQADYEAAMALIRDAKAKALRKEPQDKTFDRQFSKAMDRLAQQGCAFEIMEIVRYRETERNMPTNPLSP